MKRIVGMVIVGMMLVVGMAWAGEKEELTIKKQLIETQMQVLQLQFDKAQEQLKTVQGKLQAIAMAEKAKKAEPKK